MDAVINRFIHILKHNGLRISPSETIDALQALRHISLSSREDARMVLCSTLVKDTRDIPLFDQLFDLFFRLPDLSGGSSRHHHHDHDHHHGEQADPQKVTIGADETAIDPNQEHSHDPPADVRDYFDPERMRATFNLHQDPNRLNISSLSQHFILNRNKGVLDLVMKRLTHQLKARRVKNVAQVGDLSFGETLDQLDLDLIVSAAGDLLEDLRDLDVDEALLNQLAQQIDGVIADMPELLKRYLEREMGLLGVDSQIEEHIRSAYDYRFTEDERRAMAEILRRLGRQMRGALSQRRAVDRSGRINLSRTMRNSLQYDGIPFYPVLASRRDERPRLVVICDVSLSVRNTARFMLHLVYSLQSLFERVRSFVFVSDLAEVSGHFERLSIDEAIGAIFSGEVIDPDANSDYGRALEIFHEQYLGALTPRTTVIILGDGRGNFNPPNAWALEEIRRRSKQLIWLTPEARASWRLGGSDMPTYAPICHRVEVVRNLDQLGKVAEDLVRRSIVTP